MTTLPLGLYQHYKGNYYNVMGLGQHGKQNRFHVPRRIKVKFRQ